MKEITVFFSNGDKLSTCINGKEEQIRAYYLGKTFNVGVGEKDSMAKCIDVIFH